MADQDAPPPAHGNDRPQPSMAKQGRALRRRRASTFGGEAKPFPVEHHVDAASLPPPADLATPEHAVTDADLHAAIAPVLDAIQNLQARVAVLEQQLSARTPADSAGE